MPTGSQDKLAHCRGVRRIVHCLNMLLRVQAPDEQYLATVQHGLLLRAKFQFGPLLWVLNLIGNNEFTRRHLPPLMVQSLRLYQYLCPNEGFFEEMADDAMKSGNISINPRITSREDIILMYKKAY